MAYFSDLVPRNLEHEFDLCVTKNTFSIITPTTDSEDTSCPICMEYITDKNKTTTACGHVFHSSCIFQNMMLRTSCPMCREDLICKSVPTPHPHSNININNININNININYNGLQNNSQLMDIDDDIINALLSQDLLSQDLLSQELYYDEPPINDDANDNETVISSDSESESDSDSDADAEFQQELGNISGNSSVSVYDSSLAVISLADPDDNDDDGFERSETDLSLSDVTNKMLELGYTPEDMFYYMTWRVNPFYFNMQYLNKYNDEFYNTMTETMDKIFRKDIPIISQREPSIDPNENSHPMSLDELD